MPLLQPTKITRLARWGACLAIATAASIVHALPSDRQQPLQIKAEHNVGNTNGNVVYTGDVEITQGTLQLTADKVVAQLNQKTIHCTGKPATFRLTTKEYGLVTGRATELHFDRNNGKLKLSQDAVITKEDGSFTEGDTIVYNINNETWVVEGGVTVLPPAVTSKNKKQSNSGGVADGDS